MKTLLWRKFGLGPVLGLFTLFLLGTAALQAANPFVFNEDTRNRYTDLQDAINGANDGDTLKLNGTFVGNFIINKSVTLKGKATLDGNQTGSVLTILNLPITVKLEHLTIQHGLAALGGGIFNGATLILEKVSVVNNTATISGGGIANLTIAPSIIPYSVLLLHSNVSKNTAGEGGGIQNVGGLVTVIETQINNNTALTNGGGIANILGANTIAESELLNNTAPLIGGAIYNFEFSSTNLNHTKVAFNQSGLGGGIYNQESAITINNSSIYKNSASDTGGGFYNDNLGTAIFGFTKVVNNTAVNNGGGIFNSPGGVLNLTDTDVEHNTPNDLVD